MVSLLNDLHMTYWESFKNEHTLYTLHIQKLKITAEVLFKSYL